MRLVHGNKAFMPDPGSPAGFILHFRNPAQQSGSEIEPAGHRNDPERIRIKPIPFFYPETDRQVIGDIDKIFIFNIFPGDICNHAVIESRHIGSGIIGGSGTAFLPGTPCSEVSVACSQQRLAAFLLQRIIAMIGQYPGIIDLSFCKPVIYTFHADFVQIFHHKISTIFQQFILIFFTGNTKYQTKISFASCRNSRGSIFYHDTTIGFDAQIGCCSQKNIRLGFPFQTGFSRNNAINAGFDQMREPGSDQNGLAIFAGGSYPHTKARLAQVLHKHNRGRIGLYPFPFQHLIKSRILPVSQAADRFFNAIIRRITIFEVDIPRFEKGSYPFVARTPVDIDQVIGLVPEFRKWHLIPLAIGQ